MKNEYHGPERRKFIRLDFVTPVACKVCNPKTIEKLLKGYTVNVSVSGLLCRMTVPVKQDDVVWLSFDRSTLSVCQEMEQNCFIYQNGVIGKVVRVDPVKDGECHVGVQFITREEENTSFIFPKLYFVKGHPELLKADEDEEENTEPPSAPAENGAEFMPDNDDA